MLELEVTKPYGREFQVSETDCLTASAAMVAGGEWGMGPGPIADRLRRDLRACQRPANMVAAADALRRLGFPALALRGYDLRALAEERHHDGGGVVIGVRPRLLYAVPDGPVGHAMVMLAASRPVLPQGYPRSLFGTLVAPIELIDPHPLAPARRRLVSDAVRDAYDAQGRWAVWVPNPPTAKRMAGSRSGRPRIRLERDGVVR